MLGMGKFGVSRASGASNIHEVGEHQSGRIGRQARTDEYALSPAGVVRVIWQRVWLVALVAILVSGASAGFSLSQPPLYQSSVQLMVGQEENDEAPGNLASDIIGLQQFTQTVVEAVGSRPVAEAVVREAGLNITPSTLQGRLSVEQVPETYFVKVDYIDTDPTRAREVADTIGKVFTERISELSPSGDTITATVWEPAIESRYPIAPNPIRDGLLGLTLGLMLGIGLAFLLEHLDDSWRSPEELEEASGVPTFGIVPSFKPPKKKGRR